LGKNLNIKNSIQEEIRADGIQGMLAIIQGESFVFWFAIKKYKD